MEQSLIRVSLLNPSFTRDSTRLKGAWGVNVWGEGERQHKRFGLTLDAAGESPGQGLFVWGTAAVSLQDDTLHIDEDSFSL